MPLRRETLADQAEGEIRTAILGGRLKAGDLYSVDQLLKKLDLRVSRTPVREALVRLAEVGMVRFEPNQGARILEADAGDLQELFELRIMLEVPAVYHAVLHADTARLVEEMQDQLDMMYAIAERAEDMPADQVPGSRGFRELTVTFLFHDKLFHEAVLSRGGNQRLTSLVGHMRDAVTTQGAVTLGRTRGLRDVANDHVPILEAVRDKDASRAASAMYRHLCNTAIPLVKSLSEETATSTRLSFEFPWFDRIFPPTDERN